MAAAWVRWDRGLGAMPVLPARAGPDPTDTSSGAPATVATGGRFPLDVTVHRASSHRGCIAVTDPGTPAGPFRDALGRRPVGWAAPGGPSGRRRG